MGKSKREFIMEELMEPGFIEIGGREIFLEETEKGGESLLNLHFLSGDNLCIANVDKKRTDMQFFQEDRAMSMYKRVDHMIFERQEGGCWRLHLIEMKGSVGADKWSEIKGKFRASYLLGQAVGAMLELKITDTVMYTTFEKVRFTHSDTMPTGRRGRLGEPAVKMEDEWEKGRFSLNFGQRIPFVHRPVPMKRDCQGILRGQVTVEAG